MMKAKHYDGSASSVPASTWGASFNLADAAQLTETTVPALRTMIARNLLHHVGQRPLAGAERKLGIQGIYEIALIDELERNGLTQASASQVVGELFNHHIRAAVSVGRIMNPKDAQFVHMDEAESLALMAALPDRWIRDDVHLGMRDLTQPQLMLFAFPDDYPAPLMEMADGWDEVGRQAINFQRDIRTLGRSDSQEARQYSNAVKEGKPALPDSHPDVQSGVPVIHILNITAVLCRVDKRIAAYMPANGKRS